MINGRHVIAAMGTGAEERCRLWRVACRWETFRFVGTSDVDETVSTHIKGW